MKEPSDTEPTELIHHKRIWLSLTAHKIAKAAAAFHDLPMPIWLESAIANQAEAEGLDIEAILGVQEEM